MEDGIETRHMHAHAFAHDVPPHMNALLRRRMKLAIIVYALVITAIMGRLVQFAAFPHVPEDGASASLAETTVMLRPEIVDRNGEILATDVKVASLYAEPRKIIDPDEAAELLTATLPGLNARELREKLDTKKGFAWIKRELTPAQQQAVHNLGIPGIGFTYENHRIYPSGNVASHILGAVNIDNQGISGLEKYIDTAGLSEPVRLADMQHKKLKPLRLAVDLRVQHALRDELLQALTRYQAIAAAGMMMNVHTGEIVASVSLPDFDPNNAQEALLPDRMNRVLSSTFEMGSIFKTFTLAMGLDSGKYTMSDKVDARSDLYFGRKSISDFHGQYRFLTYPEVFTYSSNIASAKIAMAHGIEGHREFLKRIGLFDRVRTEAPESAPPIYPRHWGQINSATIAFGHGITVTPVQTIVAAGAMINGGKLLVPTYLPRTKDEAHALATQVLKPETSEAMRYLFRLNVERGTAKRAEVEGFHVGGKTGTAEKVVGGQYIKDKRFTTFLASFPADNPDYALIVILDEPHITPESFGGATAGLNAAPTAGRVIARSAQLLGMQPKFYNQPVTMVGSLPDAHGQKPTAVKTPEKPQEKPLAKSKPSPKLAQSNSAAPSGPQSLDDLINATRR